MAEGRPSFQRRVPFPTYQDALGACSAKKIWRSKFFRLHMQDTVRKSVILLISLRKTPPFVLWEGHATDATYATRHATR